MLIILSIVILIFSVILHEVSHGYMADYLGDPTPRLQGRLTINPIRHLDPIGSFAVPLLTSLAGFTFGWAKPVVYNPYNLKNKRQGEFLIAAAGPASNLLIAIIFGLILRFYISGTAIMTPFAEIVSIVIYINIVLAIFNLIPIPPLDGSKLFLAFLPHQFGQLRMNLERFGPIFVIIIIFFLWQVVAPIIPFVFNLITGVRI
ncbi:MAG: site-2 protease family protein [Candidatus Paceibacterota bacterium]|jgi:Zn-dependent protease